MAFPYQIPADTNAEGARPATALIRWINAEIVRRSATPPDWFAQSDVVRHRPWCGTAENPRL
jgi:hypothetical protein